MKVEHQLFKVCISCQHERPIEAFCKDGGYKDGRRGDCNECRQIRRHAGTERIGPHGHENVQQITSAPVYFQTAQEKDLPDPDRLPAAYLKRCADYWLDLLGNVNPTTRIA